MNIFELTRMHITGPINDDMPACVIIEIAQCLSLVVNISRVTSPVYIQDVITAIPTVKPRTVEEGKDGFSLTDYGFIACFVNPDSEIRWKPRLLVRAFKHLCTFYKVTTPPLPEDDFVVGQKTMDAPYAYNACMLYHLCRYHSVRTSRSTTLDEMAQAIRNCSKTDTELRKNICDIVNTLSRSDLLSLMLTPELTKTSKPVHRISFPDMKQVTSHGLSLAYNELTDYKHTLPRLRPKSHEEAVMLAAIVHGVNLTECINPLEEYKDLFISNKAYVPVYDAKFRERYLRNPQWFNILRTWTPNLPRIYRPENLREFAKAEGYTQQEIVTGSPEELLSLSRLTPTFHAGRHPDCVNTSTAIYMDEEKNPELLITYGISTGGPYMLYTPSELAECFSRQKSFANPADAKEQFSKIAITKLRGIAREKVHRSNQSRSSEVSTAYQSLLDAMDEVIKYNASTSATSRKLAEYYRDDKYRDYIKQYLTSLLHLAYYMRGWKATPHHQEIPVNKQFAQFPVEAQGQVFTNVSLAIKDFETNLDRLPPELRKFIRTLPLMRIMTTGDGISFQASSKNEEGKTIIDRVAIVKAGATEFSCIRLSSNWLASSAYFYMVGCGLPEPFNPKHLSNIA